MLFPPHPKGEQTKLWMSQPSVGMVFTEMYSYFAVVVKLIDDYVIVMETGPAPGCLPNTSVIREFDNADKFRRYYAYDNSESAYWVESSKMVDVYDWYDFAVENGNVVVANDERAER